MFPRFYCTETMTVDHIIELPKKISHHAIHVLRLKQGDSVTLFNGQGGEFTAKIIQSSKSCATIKIKQYSDIERESPLNIELVQAVCINEKMDWIVQKAVELGANTIQPVSTQRSIVRLTPDRAIKRLQHWQQIAIAACEQCGRNQVPNVLPLVPLSSWLSHHTEPENATGSAYLLSTTAKESLKNHIKPLSSHIITLLIGPEGGLTTAEEENALLTGFVPLRLGKRILRTESAALATIAAMQALWGDY